LRRLIRKEAAPGLGECTEFDAQIAVSEFFIGGNKPVNQLNTSELRNIIHLLPARVSGLLALHALALNAMRLVGLFSVF
jgi:hypothetical protein